MAAAMALSGTAATGGEAAVSYRQRNLKAGPQQAQTQELALTAYSHIVRSLGPSHEELLLKTYEAMDEAFSEEAEFSMFADWAPGVARPDRPISLVRAEAFADSEHKPDETPAAAVLSSRSKKFWSSAEAPTTSRLGVRLPKVQMVSAIEIVFNDTSTPPSTVPAKVQLELSEDGAAYEPVGEQVKVARPSDDSADGAAAADDGSPAEDLEAAMAAADARGSGAGGDGGEVVSVRLPVGKPIRFFRFSLTGQLEPKSTTGGSGGKPTHQVKHVSVLVPDEDAADVPAEQVIRDHCAALAVAAAPGGLSLPAKQRALNAAVYLFRATASLHVGVTLLRLLASVLSDVREAARATVPGGGEEAEAAADEAVAAPSVATALLDDMAVPALVSSQHMASEGTPGDIVQLLASAGAGGGAGSGPSLKPEFDPVHKGPGATFSNGNKTWTATRGSNNWGVAVEGISSGQASWEFEIISDMDDDEQGCCGFATRKPVIQGGYSNGGSDINCIRHYNGGLYTAGSQNRSIDAIHPGCVVRFDANMDKGEVTVFIDGSKQSGAPHFTGLKGKTIWPAVTAYGSSVSIKFKSYKKAGAKGDGDQASYHQLIHGSLPLAVGDVRSQKFVGRLGALSGQGYTKTKIKVAGARLPHAYSMWPGAGSTANARPVGGKATAASGGAASESKTGEQGGEADPAMALVGADVGLDDAYARWDMAQVIESAEKQGKEAKKKAKKGGDKDDKKKGGDKKGKKGPDKPVVDAVPSNVGVLYLQFALDDSTQKTAIPVAVDVLVDGRLAARTAPMAPTAGTMAENDFIKACVEPNDFRPATVVPSKVPQVYRVAVSRSSTVELRAKTVPGARCQSKQALAAALGKRQAARVVVACLEADTKLEGQDDFVGMRTVSQPEGTVLPPVMDHSQVGMGIGQALSQAAQVLLELCTAHNVATRQAVLVTGDDLGDDVDDDKKGKEEEEKEAEEEKGDGDDKSKGLSKAASKAKRAADALKRLRKKLEEPMAVEVRGDTLQSIGEVLKDVRGLAEIEARRFASKHGLPAVAAAKPYEVGPASQCAAGLMRAAECNLRRLVASRIDPRAVGILLPGDKGAPARGTLGGLHAALDSYVKNESGEPADVLPELRYAAANAVDAGLEVLYPTPAERRKLVAGVLGDGATLELQFAFPTVKKPPMALPGMEGLGEDGEDEDEDDLDGIASAEAGELEGCPKSRIRAIRDISKRDVRFDRAMMLAQLAAEQRGFRTELVGKWGQYLHLLVELPAPKDGAAAAAAGASESKESAGTGSDAVQFVSEELGVVFERAGMGAWQIPKGCTEPRIPMEIKRFAVFDGADRNFEQAGLGFVRLFPASACSFDRALAGVSRFVGGDGSDQADAGAGSGPASGAGM